MTTQHTDPDLPYFFLTLQKDYFTRWLSVLISFSIYLIVIAEVFATIIGVSDSLI